MSNPFTLAGDRVLVTGASSGIGRATAVLCAEMGAEVIVTGRNSERLAETFNMLQGAGHEQIVLDLTDEEAVKTMVGGLRSITGVAHCAGANSMMPFAFMQKKFLQDMLDINCVAPAVLVSSLIANKKLERGGAVVLVSSVDGPRVVHAGNGAYSASKSALVGLARNMAIDLAAKRIRVNCVLPGTTDTPMVNNSDADPEALATIGAKFPLGRIGTSREIAATIVFLLSSASSFMTGAELVVDGGYSIL